MASRCHCSLNSEGRVGQDTMSMPSTFRPLNVEYVRFLRHSGSSPPRPETDRLDVAQTRSISPFGFNELQSCAPNRFLSCQIKRHDGFRISARRTKPSEWPDVATRARGLEGRHVLFAALDRSARSLAGGQLFESYVEASKSITCRPCDPRCRRAKTQNVRRLSGMGKIQV